jgi:Ca2+-binding RTX toxin-like protein
LRGTPGDDVIDAREGDDGDDSVSGGAGHDQIRLREIPEKIL